MIVTWHEFFILGALAIYNISGKEDHPWMIDHDIEHQTWNWIPTVPVNSLAHLEASLTYGCICTIAGCWIAPVFGADIAVIATRILSPNAGASTYAATGVNAFDGVGFVCTSGYDGCTYAFRIQVYVNQDLFVCGCYTIANRECLGIDYEHRIDQHAHVPIS
jgi:hypothetical protein